jgi:hypothetical protein
MLYIMNIFAGCIAPPKEHPLLFASCGASNPASLPCLTEEEQLLVTVNRWKAVLKVDEISDHATEIPGAIEIESC